MEKNEIKIYLDFMKEFYAGMIDNFITKLPHKEKKHFKELNKLKDFYQEKIEEKTGVDLGYIKVKPFPERARNLYYNYLIDNVKRIDENKKLSNIEKEVSLIGSKTVLKLIYPLMSLATKFQNNSSSMAACYENNNIYFPTGLFHLGNLDKNRDFGHFLVHELSHALWENISKKNIHEEKSENGSEKNLIEWLEGFAEYGKLNYFNDVNFYKTEPKLANSPVYQKGYSKVKSVVDYFGEKAYLEIPKKWKSFEELMN